MMFWLCIKPRHSNRVTYTWIVIFIWLIVKQFIDTLFSLSDIKPDATKHGMWGNAQYVLSDENYLIIHKIIGIVPLEHTHGAI